MLSAHPARPEQQKQCQGGGGDTQEEEGGEEVSASSQHSSSRVLLFWGQQSHCVPPCHTAEKPLRPLLTKLHRSSSLAPDSGASGLVGSSRSPVM